MLIRRMVVQGELSGKKVFLTPMGDEIQKLAGSLQSELPQILDEALPRVGRPAKDGPLPILEFIYNHESGGNQSRKFGGREFTTLGIDWPNKKTGNASFDEEATPARKLSTSRGWGATQFTLFDGDVALVNDSGKTETYALHAGIPFSDNSPTKRPLPLAISSAHQNLVEGTSLYLKNFAGAKRECSFEPSGAATSGRSYDCKNCAKRLKTGPSTPKAGGIKSFDDAQGDFERLSGTGALYRIRTMERLRELLSPPKAGEQGVFKLPNARVPELANEADLNEFPCSWLAAIIRYSGISRRGFDYMLEAIDTMKSK